MVLSLFLTETLGVTAGGIIVPGYIAMNLDSPSRLLVTMGISLIVYLVIKLLSNFVLVYGKRRLVLALLLGFLFGYFTRSENKVNALLKRLKGVLPYILLPSIITSIISCPSSYQ